MKPTVGRIVHYYLLGEGTPRAAIIARVHEGGTVALCGFDREGNPKALGWVPYSETPDGGHWTWPPLEES